MIEDRAPWIIRDTWRDYQLVIWRTGARGRTPLPSVVAQAVLEQAARDTWARNVLARFHAEELGGGMPRPPFEIVLRELRRAVERGSLSLVVPPRPVSASGGRREKEEPEPKHQESPELSWVHVVVKNESGEPVPGLRFRLQLTDGSVREGTTDSRGAVYISEVEAGTCRVSFPGLDESSITQNS